MQTFCSYDVEFGFLKNRTESSRVIIGQGTPIHIFYLALAPGKARFAGFQSTARNPQTRNNKQNWVWDVCIPMSSSQTTILCCL